MVGKGIDQEVRWVALGELAVIQGGARNLIDGRIRLGCVVGLRAERVTVANRIIGVRRDEVGCRSLGLRQGGASHPRRCGSGGTWWRRG